MSESPYDLDAEARRRWRSGKVDGATAATILKHYDVAYRTLRAERDSLRALAVRLAEALRVAGHGPDCKRKRMVEPVEWCTCGIHAALSAARAAGLIDAKRGE